MHIVVLYWLLCLICLVSLCTVLHRPIAGFCMDPFAEGLNKGGKLRVEDNRGGRLDILGIS